MNDPDTLQRVIAKCEQRADMLNRRGCSAQARVASELAASFKSMLSQALRPRVVPHTPSPPGYRVTYRMTDRARGYPHAAYVAHGWTDDQLLAHGYMEKAL